jgi:hypothetical protein
MLTLLIYYYLHHYYHHHHHCHCLHHHHQHSINCFLVGTMLQTRQLYLMWNWKINCDDRV